MPNIIDISYFIDDIEVPNTNQEEIETDLTHSINVYEREVLIALLGHTLYKELREATWVDGDLSKWDKLVNGEDFSYTLSGRTVNTRWEGLKGENKRSLIAYYVYFHHRRKRSSYNAGVGIEVEADTDNSKPSSLYEKLVYIWNDFVAMYGGEYVEEQYVVDNYPVDEEYVNCAFNYLLAKKADFPTWYFKSLGGTIDRFGLY